MTCLFLHLITHYYAFVIVSLWLAYFLSHDYLSYINSLVFYLFSVSLWRRANVRNVRLYYPYRRYTNLFIFRFVSLLSLRSTLRLFHVCIYLTQLSSEISDIHTWKNIVPIFHHYRPQTKVNQWQWLKNFDNLISFNNLYTR